MSHRTVLVLAALLSSLPLASSLAADEPQPPADVTVLHLTEQAERQVPRDELQLTLRIETTAKTPREAEAEANRKMAAALEETKKVAAVKAETPAMNVFEIRETNKPPVWKASETLELRSKDFDAALALLGKLEDQGLLVSALNFRVSPEALKGVEDSLTAEALKRLRARAETVAADLGLAVDHVRTISVGNPGEPGPRPLMTFTGARAAAAMAPPVAEAGEAPVGVAVTAEVWLAPKR